MPGSTAAFSMTAWSISPQICSRAAVSVVAERLVEQRVDRGDLDAEVGVTCRADRAAVDDLLEEAVAVRPVSAPAVDHEAELVGLGEVRLAGVQLEVVTLRVRLDGQLDADLGQRLLQRLGGGLLLRPLGAVGDVRREAVGLAARLQRVLRLGDVAVGHRDGLVQVDLLRTRDQRREQAGRDVATGRAAVGPLVAGLVGRVQDGLAAVDVVQRRDVRVEHREPGARDRGRVGVGLQLRVTEDLALSLGADAGALDRDVEVTGQQPVVDVVALTLRSTTILSGSALRPESGSVAGS